MYFGMRREVRRLGLRMKIDSLFIDYRLTVQRRATNHSAMGPVPLHERVCVPTKNTGPNTSYVERCGHLLWGVSMACISLTIWDYCLRMLRNLLKPMLC